MKLEQPQIAAIAAGAQACIAALLHGELNGARRAVKYLTPQLVVKATRIIHRKLLKKRSKKTRSVRGDRVIDLRARAASVVLTVGVPGYLERDFIKAAQRAGEPFPVKKVQLKFLPAPK